MKLQKIEVAEAGIASLKPDAVTNATNSTLLGRSGMDGATHRAVGEGFPTISTGIYRFPIEKACKIVFDTVHEAMKEMTHIQQAIFTCFRRTFFLFISAN